MATESATLSRLNAQYSGLSNKWAKGLNQREAKIFSRVGSLCFQLANISGCEQRRCYCVVYLIV